MYRTVRDDDNDTCACTMGMPCIFHKELADAESFCVLGEDEGEDESIREILLWKAPGLGHEQLLFTSLERLEKWWNENPSINIALKNPQTVKALEINGRYFLDVTECVDQISRKELRARALAKLTKAEKDVLGLYDDEEEEKYNPYEDDYEDRYKSDPCDDEEY